MSRPDCHACRFYVVTGNDQGECRHPGATLMRGIAFSLGSHAATFGEPDEPIPATYVHEFEESGPGGPAISVEFAMFGIRHGVAAWPMRFSPTWVRACSGELAILSPEFADGR